MVVISIQRGEQFKNNLFRWEEVPGQDSNKLKQFFRELYYSDAGIWKIVYEKSDMDNTLKITTYNCKFDLSICDDYNVAKDYVPTYAYFTLDPSKTSVTLSCGSIDKPEPCNTLIESGVKEINQHYQLHFPAVIGSDGKVHVYPMPIHGEIPSSYPTIMQQIDMFKGYPENVRLIVMDGCANDVGFAGIAFSNFLLSKIEAVCYNDMKDF